MIYIIRHGETNWNKENRLQGHTDIELNTKGIEQALVLKDKLKNINFDYAYSSPLKRALKTASLITDKDIIIDNRLIERDNGLLEGKIKEEVYQIKQDKYYNEQEYHIETLEELQKRADYFMSEILTKHRGKNVLIVSHAGLIINMRIFLEGPTTDIKKYTLSNCEVYTHLNE